MSLSLQTGRKITWTYQFYFIPLKKDKNENTELQAERE